MLHRGAVKFNELSLLEYPTPRSARRRLHYFIGHVLMNGGQTMCALGSHTTQRSGRRDRELEFYAFFYNGCELYAINRNVKKLNHKQTYFKHDENFINLTSPICWWFLQITNVYELKYKILLFIRTFIHSFIAR